LLVFALIHIAVGAIQFKRADNFMLLPGIIRPPYEWRASGFYICPNHLAGLLEMMAMLALGQAFWGNHRPRTRVLAGYSALMCLAGLALTGSRGGYLSVVFGLGAFAVFSLWAVQMTRRGSFWLVFAGVLVGAVVVLGGGVFFMSQSETIRERLLQVYDPGNMRPLMWKAALTQYHLAPVAGTGSGTYLFYGRQFRSYTLQSDPMHVHNDYLELLAEYGVIGAILSGIFVLAHLVSGMAGLRNIVRDQLRPGVPQLSNDLALVVGAFAAIAALLLHSVVDFNMHIPANVLFVAFLFGLLGRPLGDEETESTRPYLPAGWWRWLTVALAVVLLGLSIRLFPAEFFAEKARVALRDDRNADALALARRGVAWEKKNPFLYGYLGEAEHFLTLSAADEATARMLEEDAATDYGLALKLFPRDTGLLLKQAQVLDLLGDFAAAEEVFQRLFVVDPMFGNVYAYYGLHWQLQKRIKEAELCFRIARRLGETDISGKGLQNIERLKADPIAQSVISQSPGISLNLPAEYLLLEP